MIQQRKQPVSKKKLKLCQSIIGLPVISGFANGDLPHYVILAWTGPRDAYLVHTKKDTCVQYVNDGKIILKRVLLQIRAGEAMRGFRPIPRPEGSEKSEVRSESTVSAHDAGVSRFDHLTKEAEDSFSRVSRKYDELSDIT